MSKLTHEEFVEKLLNKNKYYANGDFELLEQYTHSHNYIKCRCKKCGHEWPGVPSSLLIGYGCHLCRVNNWQISQDEFIERLRLVHNDIIALDKYAGMAVNIRFQCERGHIWSARPHNVLRGSGCPYCADRMVWVGYNDIWTTRPDIASLMLNPDDGYKYTKSAHQMVSFRCPDCGAISNIRINDVYNRGFSCSRCSDGISYPNKFARALLDQLPISNYDYEYHPDWLRPYFYDNYFEYNNQKYVLEMDGGLGHGKKQFGSRGKDIKGAETDAYKDCLAIQHDIHVIRVDCDYRTHGRFEHIKKNLLSSHLNVIFDLSEIDWIACDKISQESLVKQACDLYSSGIRNLNEIASILRVDRTTIHRYVKNGTQIGWCNYDPKIAIKEAATHCKKTVKVDVFDENMNFINQFYSMNNCSKQMKELYGISVSGNKIADACKTHKPYKGFNFRFANETQQND